MRREKRGGDNAEERKEGSEETREAGEEGGGKQRVMNRGISGEEAIRR